MYNFSIGEYRIFGGLKLRRKGAYWLFQISKGSNHFSFHLRLGKSERTRFLGWPTQGIEVLSMLEIRRTRTTITRGTIRRELLLFQNWGWVCEQISHFPKPPPPHEAGVPFWLERCRGLNVPKEAP